MGIFNHIGEEQREETAGIINFGILAAEYVRKEQMANYLHKGKNQTNLVKSNINMNDNKITNIKDPTRPQDAVSKRFLFKRITKLQNDFNLDGISGNIQAIRDNITQLQESLMENRKTIQEQSMALQNEIKDMSEALTADISESESGVLTKLRKAFKQGIRSIGDRIKNIEDKLIEQDVIQGELNALSNRIR
ncbi:MAG: hypothetical protein KZQ69_17505, partial [gamma proteobacterium symbiont of Bathyaustriella thionipta]|nr:hypothetical protein [gamma proteobacterium symbiont of Bathyaustriella thionipta]